MSRFPFSFWKGASSGHPKVYWYTPNVGDPWDTVGNWYSDAGVTIPLGRIPITGDYVYLTNNNSPSTGPDTLTHFSGFDTSRLNDYLDSNQGFGTVTPNIYVSAGGVLLVGNDNAGDQEWWGQTDANMASATFQGHGQLEAQMPTTGTASFTITFNEDSQVSGNGEIYNGPAVIFNDNSSQNGVIIGPFEFHGYSYNTQSGALLGSGDFFDSSQNYTDGTYYGTVYGVGTCWDSSQNNGIFNSDGYLYGSSSNNYEIYGNGFSTDYATNFGDISSNGTFDVNAANYGTVEGLATFNGASNNYNSAGTTGGVVCNGTGICVPM